MFKFRLLGSVYHTSMIVSILAKFYLCKICILLMLKIPVPMKVRNNRFLGNRNDFENRQSTEIFAAVKRLVSIVTLKYVLL